jgi:hypothetical protein
VLDAMHIVEFKFMNSPSQKGENSHMKDLLCCQDSGQKYWQSVGNRK